MFLVNQRNHWLTGLLIAGVMLVSAGCSLPLGHLFVVSQTAQIITANPVAAVGWEIPEISPVEEPFDLAAYSTRDCKYGGALQSIEAVDRYTVQFTLCSPDPAFPSKMAFSAMGIYPSEYLAETGGGGESLYLHPIGTGPYQLSEWVPGEEIILTRFDDYWGRQPREETLIFRWNADPQVRLAALQSGEADGMDNPVPAQWADAVQDDNLRLYERTGANVFYVGFNNWFAPFDDDRVRRAIAYALDRKHIVEAYYPPGSRAATQFVPPNVFGHTPEVEPLTFNPAQAELLLDRAGYSADEAGVRFKTTLYYRNVSRPYLLEPKAVAQDIQAQLAEIGIMITLKEMPSGAFLDAADRGELGMYLLGWNADYPDATNFLDYHFGYGASEQFGERDTYLAYLLNEAASTPDIQMRRDLYVRANIRLRNKVPMIPIAYGGSAVVFRSHIRSAYASPLAIENLALMADTDDDTLVWMQSVEPAGLYCADETDGEALRICHHITESLLTYSAAGTAIRPALAVSWESDPTLTVWRFDLRPDVLFHDGSAFDANDVVASISAQWDLSHPLHKGREGNFTYFRAFFKEFMDSSMN